jgi:hypothetical protein
MSYTRIVVRRGTSTEWSASNPILANGEFGFETNTGKFKIGNGASNWAALEYFANANSVKNDLIDGAPAALNTLNELAAALDDNANFATSITNLINDKAPKASPTFTGTVDFSGATVSGIILPINWMGTYDVGETYAENDMVHYEGSVYYATGDNINGASYYPTAVGADWELFASKGEDGTDGVDGSDGAAATVEVGNSYYPYTGPEGSFVVNTGTSSAAVLDFYLAPGPAGETYPDQTGNSGKFLSTDGTDVSWETIDLSLKQDVVADVTSTEIGYLGGLFPVTSSIQTQLNAKASLAQTISSKSSGYTLQASDSGSLITNSAAITVTVPDVLQNGERVDFIQTNSGQITFSGSGITINSADAKLKTAKQFAGATIQKAGGAYYLIGNLA